MSCGTNGGGGATSGPVLTGPGPEEKPVATRVDSARTDSNATRQSGPIEFKQATMPDAAKSDISEVFESVRPSYVLDQSTVEHAVSPETSFEHALGQVAVMDVRLTNRFVDQFNAGLRISGYRFPVFPEGVDKTITKVFPEQF